MPALRRLVLAAFVTPRVRRPRVWPSHPWVTISYSYSNRTILPCCSHHTVRFGEGLTEGIRFRPSAAILCNESQSLLTRALPATA